MELIPSLFEHDKAGFAVDRWTPGFEGVRDGSWTARRKYNGHACDFDGSDWWVRRVLRGSKARTRPPEGFRRVYEDAERVYGWAPAAGSFYGPLLRSALEAYYGSLSAGTYELLGPEIADNTEKVRVNCLVRHDAAPVINLNSNSLHFRRLRWFFMENLKPKGIEGIVWYGPKGERVQLKVTDFWRDKK